MNNKMNKMVFDMFKNIIIEQNKELLHQVSQLTGKDEKILLEKYIKPDFYLPIIIKTTSGTNNTMENNKKKVAKDDKNDKNSD